MTTIESATLSTASALPTSSIGEHDRYVTQVAARLASFGVEAGSTVLVAVTDAALRARIAQACWLRGALVVVVDPRASRVQRARAHLAAQPTFAIGDAVGLLGALRLDSVHARIAATAIPRNLRAALGATGHLVAVEFDPIESGTELTTRPADQDDELALIYTPVSDRSCLGIYYSRRDLRALGAPSAHLSTAHPRARAGTAAIAAALVTADDDVPEASTLLESTSKLVAAVLF